MDIDLIIMFLVGVVAGGYGVLVGGGSLLTIPALMLLGVPPITAVASNRLGILGAIIGSIYNFAKKSLVDWKLGFLLVPFTFLGAFIGANSIQRFPEDLLEKIIGVIILTLLLVTIFKRKTGLRNSVKEVTGIRYGIGSIFAFIISFIGSISGGVGALASYNLIYIFGQTFLESAGTRKILGIVGAATAAIVYIFAGVIDYKLSAAIFLGSFIGGYFSSYFADKIGNLWVKRLFIVVVGIMAIKLLV